MNISWKSADCEQPSKDGKYIVTLTDRDGVRRIGQSTYEYGRWASIYVVAWLDIAPYTDDSKFEMRQLERRRASEERLASIAFLRAQGKSYAAVGKEFGISYSAARAAVHKYMRSCFDGHLCEDCMWAERNVYGCDVYCLKFDSGAWQRCCPQWERKQHDD